MTISSFEWAGLSCALHRKTMKNIRVRLLPPTGGIQVSAPHRAALKTIIAFLDSKHAWIMGHLTRMQAQTPPPAPPQLQSETTVQLYGVSCSIVQKHAFIPKIIHQDTTVFIHSPAPLALSQQQKTLDMWLRAQLLIRLKHLLPQWLKHLGVSVHELRLKRMKTRWGTCNPKARRIWINSVLIHYPLDCIEYVLVHELVHLLEPSHNRRFYQIMSDAIPHWKIAHQHLKNSRIV